MIAVSVIDVGTRIAVPKFTKAPARKFLPLIVSVNPIPFGADDGESDVSEGIVPSGGCLTSKESLLVTPPPGSDWLDET